ncbi:MAG: hypothetical protein ACERLB_16105, partial [Gammaproteobacteria bacterium]
MALIRQILSFFPLLTLLLFTTSVLAELDPEINKQIAESDSQLTIKEKSIKRSKEWTVVELKEMALSVSSVKTQAKTCIAFNESSI